MNWYHEVDVEWLRKRKKYITASDIVNLRPSTPTGRLRDISHAKMAVCADKCTDVLIEDRISRGAAARGHILEPYAIQAFNDSGFCSETIYHWDDALIHKGYLSYSPDALSVEQPNKGMRVEHSADAIQAKILVEVKSYKTLTHYEAARTPKELLMERWQLATAFAVSSSLEEAYLVFFNPSCKHKMFVKKYLRADLKDEIEIAKGIESAWAKDLLDFEEEFSKIYVECDITEAQIIAAIEAEMNEMNPNYRSV